MSQPGHQVLVVGAGPTGLLLAAELRRRGVDCLLVDALDAPRGWDRATVVHARSLEIFEALGLAERFTEAGVKTPAARFHSEGAVLGELRLDAAGGTYGFDLGISEEVTESILTDALEAAGGAVTRSTSLVGLDVRGGLAVAVLESGGERREVTARFVVGCDGIHSAVREAAGIGFPGRDIEPQWAVFDAAIDGWTRELDVASAHLDQPPVIMTPLPGGRFRVYLRPTSEQSDLVADATEVIRRYEPDATFTDVHNPTRFTCHSRVADRYRSGPVLLAGDAAHACTPAEGHGMNTGLQDAFNLGWKLALVSRGEAGPALLDTYEAERRPVAEGVVASGDAVEAGQALADPQARAERDAAIRQTFSDPETAHHEAAAAAEVDRCYPRCCAVVGDPAGPAGAGRRLPETAPVEPAAGAPQPLHCLAHRAGHTLFVLGGPQADPARVAALAQDLDGRLAPIVDAVVGLAVRPHPAQVGRLPAAAAAQLGIEHVTVLGIRPDRYVGLRDDTGDPRAADAYVGGIVAA